jgi:hypothetical protein
MDGKAFIIFHDQSESEDELNGSFNNYTSYSNWKTLAIGTVLILKNVKIFI